MTTPFDEATAEIEVVTKVRLSIELVAQWFANLDDDAQARFFVAVCEEAKKWPKGSGGLNFGPSYQWYLIGSHLRNCACSSDAARDMIREMHGGLETGSH